MSVWWEPGPPGLPIPGSLPGLSPCGGRPGTSPRGRSPWGCCVSTCAETFCKEIIANRQAKIIFLIVIFLIVTIFLIVMIPLSPSTGTTSHSIATRVGRQADARSAADSAASDGKATEIGSAAADADAGLERWLRST